MNDWTEWLVDVPEYDADGVVVERFVITEDMEAADRLRAYFNPQREDRSIRAGTFTRFTVDGNLWMTDTPAEIYDLYEVDQQMRTAIMFGPPTSVLIVGLGLGVVLNRAIKLGIERIDVVECDNRVVNAVMPHYLALAKEHNVELTCHVANIHDWRPDKDAAWNVAWFDIWLDIDMDDRPEVARLRRRFLNRAGWVGAWAQAERNSQAKRIREKRGFY